MIYNTFQISKISNTYSETLEAYGLAHLVKQIYNQLNINGNIIIQDLGLFFMLNLTEPISAEMLGRLSYFQVIEFLKKDEKTKLPNKFGKRKYFDYPQQKKIKDQLIADYEKIKELGKDEKRKRKEKIQASYHSKDSNRIRDDYDIFAQLSSNPYTTFTKLFNNFYNNQSEFQLLISEILNYYYPIQKESKAEYKALIKNKKIISKVTLLQLFNPSQGKGLNKTKASGISTKNLTGNWIKETMKIIGAIKFGIVCQSIKIGRGYDLKIFVPVFNEMKLYDKETLMREFKNIAKSHSPIKLDIMNLLEIINLFLNKSQKSQHRKLRDHFSGFHSVYQKDLGQNKAVSNISFLQTPRFINLEKKQEWIDIINDQKKIIKGIIEQGATITGLQAYRNFLTDSSIDEYFKFIFWYAIYLMHELSNKKQTYVRTNKIEILNKIFNNLNSEKMKFTEIIENQGFQSIAKAIRNSTVTLQYTPKDKRKYEIQYGIAQKLKNKSKTKKDLATFVGEFISKYNSDIARQSEKTGQSYRSNVRSNELKAFFELLDDVDSKVLGAMLAAYGFALNQKNPKDGKEYIEEK